MNPHPPGGPGSATPQTTSHVLSGLRVLDVGHILAGPMTSSLLGDFGADVIHVESPTTGNFRRELIGAAGEAGRSRAADVINRNKRNVAIDLRRPEGRDLLHQLVRVSDVLTENFRPHVMDRWGNDWATLHELNPRLIYCRMSGFGDTGPRQGRRAYGRIAEAWSGWAHVNGYADGPALHSGFSLGDSLQSAWAANAIMMALYWRDARDGSGQMIDSGLVEPLFRAIEQQVIIFDQNQASIRRFGTEHEGCPYCGITRTGDGRYFAWSAFTSELVGRLLRLFGVHDDRRFSTAEACIEHREAFQTLVADWMETRTTTEVWAAFEAHGAAGSPVMSGEDLFHDPHVRSRGLLVTLPDPEGGPDVTMQGVVPKLSRTPGAVTRLCDRVGAHDEAIFCGLLGTTRDELARLRELGVIAAQGGADRP